MALSKRNYISKAIIIGNARVGKTNLINKFISDKFDPHSKTTIGVEFLVKDVEPEKGINVKLQIWDTAGEERFRAITDNFYRGADAIIIVFDLTNRESFNTSKGYFDRVSQSNYLQDGNVKFILVGAKADLNHARVVSNKEIETLAKELKCEYVETSAITGDGVAKVFDLVAKHGLKNARADEEKERLEMEREEKEYKREMRSSPPLSQSQPLPQSELFSQPQPLSQSQPLPQSELFSQPQPLSQSQPLPQSELFSQPQPLSQPQPQISPPTPSSQPSTNFFQRHWYKILIGALIVGGIIAIGVFTGGVGVAIAGAAVAGGVVAGAVGGALVGKYRDRKNKYAFAEQSLERQANLGSTSIVGSEVGFGKNPSRAAPDQRYHEGKDKEKEKKTKKDIEVKDMNTPEGRESIHNTTRKRKR